VKTLRTSDDRCQVSDDRASRTDMRRLRPHSPGPSDRSHLTSVI
jgi:hypothetical protein